MKFALKALALLTAALFLLSVPVSCVTKNTVPAETPTGDPTGSSGSETPAPTPDTPTPTPTPVTPTPTPTPIIPYEFPEDGVIKALTDGKAPGVPDGRNPSFAGDKLVVFFEFAFRNAWLDLADDTVIDFKFKDADRNVTEGSAQLDLSVPEIKTENGYIGVCFDPGVTVDRFKSATFEFSFKDRAGKEYFVKNQSIFRGVSYLGLSADKFDEFLGDYVTTTVLKQTIKQKGTVNGVDYEFTLNLGGWDGNTSAKQIITCTRLFWYCYPRMYARFGAAGKSPTSVELRVENFGYGIAEAGGNSVHIHDMWLKQNSTDFDCLTHEFAHVIQAGWNGNFCEYSGYIERFADCCRYIYAFENGTYNDRGWTLNTISGESTRETSVRFLVWLDYMYSTKENDILLRWFNANKSMMYPSSRWNQAWEYIFQGSELEGLDIDTVWEMYATSNFAKLDATGRNGKSKLLNKYNVREKTEELFG